MTYFVQWQEEYALAHPVIDEQHQMLFLLANRLFGIVEESGQRAKLQDLFTELFAYTQKHFQEEELIWQPLEDSLRQRHRSKHRELKNSLQEIWSKDSIFTTSDTLYWLQGWIQELLEHITQFDRSMYQQLLVSSSVADAQHPVGTMPV
ncbi:bacteriohemerythrin [Candidatus Magnetaquicoccus inordinatus]|uniref:bacteriohemerythrin n=1 Tax=Candidatus Magnetaquicoccus inordinatus TaxID=2496818 RepID=UPI00187D174C|nr:hemerythrin family protein [Candidatus Magnetaquicoccus inordinatus]